MHDMAFVSSNELHQCKKNLFYEKRAAFEKRGGDMSSAKQEGSRSTRTGGHRDVYNACRESNQSGSQMPCGASRSRDANALSGRGCLVESRVAGSVSKMVEEKDAESDLEYGPGIVDKLKSRFIHLTLKESQKHRTPLRRFSSLENMVQDERFQAIGPTKGDRAIVWRNRAKYGLSTCGKTNFKKAQSMETLVLKSDERNKGAVRTINRTALPNENIIIVENATGSGGREEMANPMACEELPRPDTVKTYKRMFEPAESKPLCRRRPPVLRASAKSSSNKNNSLVKPSAIVNGEDTNGAIDSYRRNEKRVSSPAPSNGLLYEKKKEPTRNVAPVKKDLTTKNALTSTAQNSPARNDVTDNASQSLPSTAPARKDASKNGSQNLPSAAQGSLVFDFRGKSTKPNVSLQPTPFGCKPVQKSVRKTYLIDGKESLPPGSSWDDEDDDLDGQTDLPLPSGIKFEGENVRLEKNCLLSTRNKKLTIQFNDNATSVHEYPSEVSLLENSSIVNGSRDEAGSASLSFSGGLASYTPKGLETVKPFQLGVAKPPSHVEVPELTDTKEKETEELKPADPDSTCSWSSSTATSDLLF